MITITPLDKIGSDERGYTYEYFHERYGRHLVCYRKAGSVSGRHYHKGLSLTKQPEIILLMHGNLMVHYRNINSATVLEVQVEGPARIEIQPFVWHEFISITDCVFLELNSMSEHEADTFRDV